MLYTVWILMEAGDIIQVYATKEDADNMQEYYERSGKRQLYVVSKTVHYP